MLRMAVLGAALAGCSYHPGAFSHGVGPEAAFEGRRATIGCLDLSVHRRADYEDKAVLHYRFGNRCGRAVQVDLSRVAVIARLGDGRELELAPFDPDLVLRPLALGGRLAGGEAIAYPTPAPAAQVCVDAASIAREHAARAGQPAQWLCFGNETDVGGPSAVPDEVAADNADAPLAAAPGAPGSSARFEEVSP